MIKLKNIQARTPDRQLFFIEKFIFEDGKRYLLTGENGCGKSSLLKFFINMSDIVSGEITIDSKIVYQPQNALIFRKTPRENFKLLNIDLNKIKEEISQFKIGDLLDQNIDMLSGGEKQKFIFLRSISVAKESLILDEPFSEMDKDSRIIAENILNKWFGNDPRKMIIYVSHNDYDRYPYDFHVEIANKSLNLVKN